LRFWPVVIRPDRAPKGRTKNLKRTGKRMKIALASDIHLEFGPIELKMTESADVLILAGDICQAVDVNNDTTIGRTCQTFFKQCSDRFPKVVYIMGNHEHYQGDYARSRERLQKMLDTTGVTMSTCWKKTL
jgi:predicted phosphodiesterase